MDLISHAKDSDLLIGEQAVARYVAQDMPRPTTVGEMLLPSTRSTAFELGERFQMVRKLWEYVVVAQGYMRHACWPGSKILGFGVGREPLPAFFASRGSFVVATDQGEKSAGLWTETEQWGGAEVQARKNVAFREVDMRDIPEDLMQGQFDFTWSCCAFEHLGSLEAGMDFFIRQMRCLKPGGWAFHTTEFNVLSNTDTLKDGDVVAYRRRDIATLIDVVRHLGDEILDPDWDLVAECDAALPETVPHLTLKLGSYAVTSFLLAARRGGKNV